MTTKGDAMDTTDLPTPSDLRDDYDWQQAFAYAGGGIAGGGTYTPTDHSGAKGESPMRSEGAQCSDATFNLGDVDGVLAVSEGENDGPAWLAIVHLKDHRYAYIEAGCDYTGWDCQASGSATVSHDLANLWQFGSTQEARERFLADPRTHASLRAL